MPILGIIASQISGRLWAPYGAYDALSTVTVPSGGVASITFAAIPQGYKHLQVRATTLCATGSQIFIRFNSDTGANYSFHLIVGTGASAQSGASTSSNFIFQNFFTATQSANPLALVVDVLDYTSVNKNKTTRSLIGIDTNGGGVVGLVSGSYMSATAISNISFTDSGGNIAQHSQFTLYGVR